MVSVCNPYVGSLGDCLVPYSKIPTRRRRGFEETKLEDITRRRNGLVA